MYAHRQKWKVRTLSSEHKSRVAQAAIHKWKFEQLNHPPYRPDLAPSNYYLFRNSKSHLRGARFRDDNELKVATEVCSDFPFLPMGIGFPTKSKSNSCKC